MAQDTLTSFPLSGDESRPGSQHIRGIYGRVRSAASSVISTLIPEDQTTSTDSSTYSNSLSHSVDSIPVLSPPVRRQLPPLATVRKSQPSVAISSETREGSVESSPFASLGLMGSEIDQSDVESLFSTASYSLSRTYLATQYRQGRKRALNSLGKEFWMKDENAKTCFRCSKPFTTFRRRHHCRVCGQIFCSACAKLIPGNKFQNGSTSKIRCCLNCLTSLSSQHSSSEDEGDMSLACHEDSPTRERTPRSQSILHPQSSFEDSPRNFTLGSSFSPSARANSISMPTNLNNPNYLLTYDEKEEQTAQSPPMVFGRSRSNTNRSSRSVARIAAVPPSNSYSATTTAIFPQINYRQETMNLNNAMLKHLKLFLDKVLEDSELDVSVWHKLLLDPILAVTDLSRVDTTNREAPEPRYWVKLKRIPGGAPKDTEVLLGQVFTHNVQLRSMPQKVLSPRILMISFPLEYARGESRYMSLTPVLAQEKEFLRKLVARIEHLKPTVLLSSSHISGLALKLLHNAGIVVATNIRETALQRLSRYTKSEILTSMDRLSIRPQLGLCNELEVRTYRDGNVAKSFMFFTGIPEGSGCTILIRGSKEDTKKAKTVLEIMTEVSYNLKAETSLMRDQFALLPELDDTSSRILSSSPFVYYGQPYLYELAGSYEDSFVKFSNRVNEIEKLILKLEPKPDSEAIITTSEDDSEAPRIVELSSEPEGNKDDEEALNKSVDEIIDTVALPDVKVPGGKLELLKLCKAVEVSKRDYFRKKWTDSKQNWEQLESTNPYMFNPCSHQSITVSFFLKCNKTDAPCVGPDTMVIDFYLDSDLALGQFIEAACKTYNEPCPDGCENVLGEHRRCYYHNKGIVTIKVAKHACEISGLQDTILMWNHCKICDSKSPLIPMSASTWNYSFGKYLELSFYGTPLQLRAGTCNHNLYRDYVRYFGWYDMAVSVDYTPIELYEVILPPLQVSWRAADLITLKIKIYQDLNLKIKKFWASLLDSLSKVKIEGLDEEKLEEATSRLSEMKAAGNKDRTECLYCLDEVFERTDATDYLGLNAALRFVQGLVTKWHNDFNNFDGLFFPTEGDIRRVTAQQLKGMFFEDEKKASATDAHQSDSASQMEDNDEKKDKTASKPTQETDDQPQEGSQAPSGGRAIPLESGQQPAEGDSTTQPKIPLAASEGDVGASGDVNESLPSSSALPDTTVSNSVPDKYSKDAYDMLPFSESSKQSSVLPVKSKFGTTINFDVASLQRKLPLEKSKVNKVSLLARHFEDLSREFERERQREKQRLLDRQSVAAVRRTKPVATVFKDVREAVREDDPEDVHSNDGSDTDSEHDQDDEHEEYSYARQPPLKRSRSGSSGGKTTNTSLGDDEASQTTRGDDEDEEGNDEDDEQQEGVPSSSTQPAGAERKSLIKSLVNFWAERSSTRWSGIDYVLSPSEHVFSDSIVVIRENEPSSLVAFCLSLPDHEERMQTLYSDDKTGLEQVLNKQTSVHMRYNFVNGGTTMSCKIFFSEQFDALRKACHRGESFVQSLSRCMPWESSGGKSGSVFLKTLDNKFLLKSISQVEFDSWTSFAPSYFNYMSQALFHDLPTALAKIFGVYQIHIRNPSSSKNIKMYIVVSENLFAGRNFDRFFDLKGSMRNRKVAETGKANEVLLDENMVEYIYDKPMYVREHSKRVLRASLYNDTLFLTKMNVMDYSLVIGIDEDTNTIVAGIIDYIRTFTWDKKIESWVKGRTSSGVKDPTVISPKQYKSRFRESMEQYFLLVPDCWHQFQD